jgi:predicted metalloprotease with PDZ domain
MVKMWHQFGKDEIGYTPEQLQEAIELIAGVDLTDFFKRYIDGTEDLPFNEYLEPFGLQLAAEKEEEPYLGLKVHSENGREIIKFVEAGSPAQFAGIDPGDELLAIDGLRLAANGLGDRLKDYQPKDIIQVTIFHQDELCTLNVTLASPRFNKHQIKPVEKPSAAQKENFAGWLGVPLTTLR